MCVSSSEGSTGILSLSKGTESTKYFPNYDMDAAQELLLEFQELRDCNGVALKNNYWIGDRNWYPCMVSQLFWYLFFPFVKYRLLVEQWISGETEFECGSTGNFAVLMGHLRGCKHKVFHQRVHDILWRTSNRLVARRNRAHTMFFRFARNDFRSVEILAAMKSEGMTYLEAVPAPSTRKILTSILCRKSEYYFAQPNKTVYGNQFQKKYGITSMCSAKAQLFLSAVRFVEESITTCIRERSFHYDCLSHMNLSVFYGLDDINTYLFPLLFAAKDLHIPTIGHQHGAYVKRHAGYMMRGLAREDIEWFDRVIVWGDYWKEKMHCDAPIHPPERWVVGSNKLRIPYAANVKPVCATSASHPTAHRVLIPYEFLADTKAIGRYITRMLELGYEIFFRPRKDEPLDAQIAAYDLRSSDRSQLRIADGPLDMDLLNQIDIVAGTMTTLIYEMLPAGKIIWYLDTPYRHLLDLVEERLAHRIRLEDLRAPDQMPEDALTRTFIDADRLFGKKCLNEVIREHVKPAVLSHSPK